MSVAWIETMENYIKYLLSPTKSMRAALNSYNGDVGLNDGLFDAVIAFIVHRCCDRLLIPTGTATR